MVLYGTVKLQFPHRLMCVVALGYISIIPQRQSVCLRTFIASLLALEVNIQVEPVSVCQPNRCSNSLRL